MGYNLSMEKKILAGGISGGIADPDSERAIRHAETFYEGLRHRNDDVAKIAANTGYSEGQIRLIKNYLFIFPQILDEKTGEMKRFDECFEIADSWGRLERGNPEPHDYLLLQHELHEIGLVRDGIPQDRAHDMTNEVFNYQAACNRFYEQRQKDLEEKQRKHLENNNSKETKTINAGAVIKQIPKENNRGGR